MIQLPQRESLILAISVKSREILNYMESTEQFKLVHSSVFVIAKFTW